MEGGDPRCQLRKRSNVLSVSGLRTRCFTGRKPATSPSSIVPAKTPVSLPIEKLTYEKDL